MAHERKIQPQLLKFMLSRVPAKRQVLESFAPEELLVIAGKSLLGVQEESHNDGELIRLIQSTVGGASKESWCMSAVQSCIAFVEELKKIKSPFPATEHCMTAWRDSHKDMKLTSSLAGRADVLIWQHGTTSSGHTGIITSSNAPHFYTTMEGNTSNGPGVERDGDGFFMRMRPLGAVGTMKIKGAIEVFP